ncbi:MAG TPA: single-stranded DNA-binding protein [Chloroflexota bacterium]|jgi:single-strand DNA-binding protein
MLRVTLLGNLGADPEVRYTQKGGQFVQFRVAVNMVRFGADGERQENTEWFRVRVSGRQSEYAQRLGKGGRALVIGRLDISHYQSKDGETRVGYDVFADDIQIVSAPRAFGAEVGGPEAEAEPVGEPALAGVSSLKDAAASGNGRGRAPKSESGGRAGAASEDLEDLPF